MKYKIAVIIGILILVGVAYSRANIDNTTNSSIGSDSKGYVTKEVYSHPGSSGPKIAIITGMHPREISAKDVVPDVIKSYVLTHNVEIVNYQINVTDQPDDFATGRHNGESLVAQYVVPDIAKSNYSLVIICHDHKQGYGTGYYIATPTMDAKSVALGNEIHAILPDFSYYMRHVDQKSESTSINGVDNPIVAAGTSVFVYEIPEWMGNSDVYNNTNLLIDAAFKVI